MTDTNKTSARVILTTYCHRKCSYCVNKQAHIKKAMKPLHFLTDLKGYKDIVLTGGEPLADPELTMSTLVFLKKHYPHQRLFLYTAWWHGLLIDMLPLLNGITFTLHNDLSDSKSDHLLLMQEDLDQYKGKSNRLVIDSKINEYIELLPSVWSSIKFVEWRDECTIPENEDLFILL